MNLILTRTAFRPDGIFSRLADEANNEVAITIEHAYLQPDGTYKPKLIDGVYTCVRGQHQLAHMTAPFTTFEITNVPGHTNILFHVGNYNEDSDGCVCTGQTLYNVSEPWMIRSSKPTFNKFMAMQSGIDQFPLTVRSS